MPSGTAAIGAPLAGNPCIGVPGGIGAIGPTIVGAMCCHCVSAAKSGVELPSAIIGSSDGKSPSAVGPPVGGGTVPADVAATAAATGANAGGTSMFVGSGPTSANS
jgi:hypothetical protein